MKRNAAMLALLALLCYGPGILLPALHVEKLGRVRESSILSSITLLLGTDVRLDPAEGGAEVRATLTPEGQDLAREGSQFWIVRPSISLAAGVSGLDTVAGDNYLTVRPATSGKPAAEFVGAEEAPLPDVSERSLTVIVNARRQSFGLRRGAIVTCCGMPIGMVRRVDLNKDGRGVTAIACIEPEHVDLVYKAKGMSERSVVQVDSILPKFKGRFDLQALGGGIELEISANPEPRSADWQPMFDLIET